jgi:hypothetical protein
VPCTDRIDIGAGDHRLPVAIVGMVLASPGMVPLPALLFGALDADRRLTH